MQNLFWIVGLLLFISACTSNATPLADVDSLPTGDAQRGAELFTQRINGAPSCASCHTLTDVQAAGPGLAGYSQRVATRVEGLSALDYTYNSILHPSSYIVDGYSNLMYQQFRNKLNNQALADIIAYLLTL
ncbi:MAG: cytochrome c [Anaerolineae bacterium]|nr:cytochrome c [Anaerolineae bacterium]